MDTRKAAYFLIAIAIAGNSILAFWYSGMDEKVEELKERLTEVESRDDYVEVDSPVVGDSYVTEYNLSMSVTSEDGSGNPETGNYDLRGSMERRFLDGSMDNRLRGEYVLVQSSNSSKSPVISGSLDRHQNTSFEDGGALREQLVNTEITTDGGSLKSVPGSRIKTYGRDISGIWDEVLWTKIIQQCSHFSTNSTGSVSLDLDLEGVGLSMDSAIFDWKANGIVNGSDGRRIIIVGELTEVPSFKINFNIVFKNGSRFPSLYEIFFQGRYYSGGRDISVSMEIKEVSIGKNLGNGPAVPPLFRDLENSDPSGERIDLVPRDGATPTKFPSTPTACVDFALGESDGLNVFLNEYGREKVSASRMRFQLNDTMLPEPMYIWNITFTAECQYLLHPQYTIVVGTEVRGGMVKRDTMRILNEYESLSTLCPDAERSIVDMATEERGLKDDPEGDQFFLGDIYSPNYRLDMVSRDGSGAPFVETLFMRAFGMKRMESGDYFISQVQDNKEMNLHAAAINGFTGELDYRITASGPCVPLISSYGIDPA